MTDVTIAHIRYPDKISPSMKVEGKLVRVPNAHSLRKRPYKYISWLDHVSGLTEAGAQRELERMDFDCNEGRATAIEINIDEVQRLRRR